MNAADRPAGKSVRRTGDTVWRAICGRVAAALLGLVLSGCASRGLVLPDGAGVTFPQYAQSLARVTESCRGIRSMTAELRLSGRSGTRRVRGRVLAGISSPDSMRLEGLAPFGAPGFILVAAMGRGTLVLPRDNRVLVGEPPEMILEALIGLSLRPGELLAVATGCVSPRPEAIAGRAYPGGWGAVDLADGSTVFLRDVDATPRLVAATRPGLVVEYRRFAFGRPAEIRVRSSRAGADGRPRTDVIIGFSQWETNRTLGEAVFEVNVPASASPLTLDQLRQAGPLGDGPS